MAREDLATHIVKLYGERVLVRSPEGEYVDSAANFALDSGRAFPALPAARPGELPYIGRTYIPNTKHNLTNGSKNVPQPLPWAPGDVILTTVGELVSAKEDREAAESPKGPSLNELYNLALDAFLVERAGQPNPPQAVLDYVNAKPAGGTRA